MKRSSTWLLGLLLACGGDGKESEPASQLDASSADAATDAAAADASSKDAAALTDASAEIDSAAPDAAAPSRACNMEQPRAFVGQASYPKDTTFETSFDCGSGGELLERAGPPENRVNLVVLGDGYRQAELGAAYKEHVGRLVAQMFSSEGEPYLQYRKYINVCRLDVASNQSGTDIPDEGVQVDTAFDGNGSDSTRLGLVNDRKVDAALDRLLMGTRIDADWIAVTLNVNRWFNSGGRLMIWSGARPGKPDVAIHEAGHSWHALADEYGGNAGTRYSGAEVRELNVTIDSTGAKWKNWLDYDQPGVGKIGAYEGGRYYDRGIYRPSSNSKMNLVPALYNAPCMEKVVRDIYRLVKPVDAWTANEGELDNPCALTLSLVDPERVQVEWQIDGAVVESADEARLDLAAAIREPGLHMVSARVFDPTPLVRGDRAGLEQTLRWSVRVP